MSNWDELKGEDDPKVNEIKQQREHEAKHKKYLVSKDEWESKSCYIERQRLYDLLGLKKVGEDVKYHSSSTGQYEITKTSESTYKMSEKKNIDKEVTYIFEVETCKIADAAKYELLKDRIDRFFLEAEHKFAAYKKDGEVVVPIYFDIKERFKALWKQELKMFLLMAITIIMLPFWLIPRILYHVNYNKKHAECIPLANAYLEQVKVFEDEIREIVN